MCLKEIDKRLSKILDTQYHANEMLNLILQKNEIEKMLRMMPNG